MKTVYERTPLRKTGRKGEWEKHQRRCREIIENAGDILHSANFQKTKQFLQHGDVSVNSHSLSVARHSMALSDLLAKWGISTKRRELIRGALLHDYFLYDWHKKHPDNVHKNLHGFYHPGIALKNASREYKLSEREKDIIKKHMWPLTVVPPACREAWIVTAADKWCSAMETFHIHRGHREQRVIGGNG